MQRQKIYNQHFKPEWVNRICFKGWLKSHPQDDTKSYCSLCHVVMKAHLCDIKKHGSSLKHKKAKKLIDAINNVNKKEPFYSDEEAYSSEESTTEKWSVENTLDLIRKLKDYWPQFKSGTRKKQDIHEEIAKKLAEETNFIHNSNECYKKFRNMKMRYLFILKKKGDDPNFKPRVKYFDELDDLLKNDDEAIAITENKIGIMSNINEMKSDASADIYQDCGFENMLKKHDNNIDCGDSDETINEFLPNTSYKRSKIEKSNDYSSISYSMNQKYILEEKMHNVEQGNSSLTGLIELQKKTNDILSQINAECSIITQSLAPQEGLTIQFEQND